MRSKSMNRTYSAFSLLELVVVMIVGSITITIISYCLFMVISLVNTHQKIQAAETDKLKLVHELRRDFYLSDKIESNSPNQLSFLFGTSEIDYIFSEDFLIRQNGTFNDSIALKNARWEIHKNNIGFIDELGIFNNLKYQYHFSKEYFNSDYWANYKTQNHKN